MIKSDAPVPSKLRPGSATPPDEECDCRTPGPIVLQPHLTSNPLVCLACHGEIAPERLAFDAALAVQVAQWQQFHDAFYALWLDSGEFEDWARKELEDLDSVVNRRGRSLVAKLNAVHKSYYWVFRDSGHDAYQRATGCPTCSGVLDRSTSWPACDRCLLVIAD